MKNPFFMTIVIGLVVMVALVLAFFNLAPQAEVSTSVSLEVFNQSPQPYTNTYVGGVENEQGGIGLGNSEEGRFLFLFFNDAPIDNLWFNVEKSQGINICLNSSNPCEIETEFGAIWIATYEGEVFITVVLDGDELYSNQVITLHFNAEEIEALRGLFRS